MRDTKQSEELQKRISIEALDISPSLTMIFCSNAALLNCCQIYSHFIRLKISIGSNYINCENNNYNGNNNHNNYYYNSASRLYKVVVAVALVVAV
jgi:hypothetical protein